MDSAIKELIDQRDCQAVGLRYARALDSKDFDLLLSAFTPDASWGPKGGAVQGHGAIRSRAQDGLQHVSATQHVTTNFEVTVNGDAATMRSCYLATHVGQAAGGEAHWVVAGIYDDRLVRTAEGWRIAVRDMTNLWQTGDPAILGQDFAARIGRS